MPKESIDLVSTKQTCLVQDLGMCRDATLKEEPGGSWCLADVSQLNE